MSEKRNIVPNGDNDGEMLGRPDKRWSAGYIETLHGTADKANEAKTSCENYAFTIKKGTVSGSSGVSTLFFESNSNKKLGMCVEDIGNGALRGAIFGAGVGYYIIFENLESANSSVFNCSFPRSPIAPTPITSDNSTKLATTQFVKAQSATMLINTLAKTYTVNQYWAKEPSGTITQYVEVDMNDEQEIDVLFPISFPQKCMFLDVEIINADKDTNLYCAFHTIERTVDGAKLLKVGTGSPKKIVVRTVGI